MSCPSGWLLVLISEPTNSFFLFIAFYPSVFYNECNGLKPLFLLLDDKFVLVVTFPWFPLVPGEIVYFILFEIGPWEEDCADGLRELSSQATFLRLIIGVI